MSKKPLKPITPMMQEYIDFQKMYPDAIIAMEVGVFFEIMGIKVDYDDGSSEYFGYPKQVAPMLDLVATKKNKANSESPDLCGFPNHASDGYFKKIIAKGHTVVVVEQSIKGEDADMKKGFKRSITKILSPGTAIDTHEVNNIYFGSIFTDDSMTVGITLIDVGTGEVKITECMMDDCQDFLRKYDPKEILVTGKFNLDFFDHQLVHKNSEQKTIKKLAEASVLIENIYKIKNITNNISYSLEHLGLEKWRMATLALGNLLNYLASAEHSSLLLKKISKPDPLELSNSLHITMNGYESLDILPRNDQMNDKKSLFGILNRCQTAMGSRLLKQWILQPLCNMDKINERLNLVDNYQDDQYNVNMKNVYDVPRLSRRLMLGKLMPHEMNHLHSSLLTGKEVLELLQDKNSLKDLINVASMISDSIDLAESQFYTDSMMFNFFKGPLLKQVESFFNDWKECETKLSEYKNLLESKLGSKLKLVDKSESIELVAARGLAAQLKSSKIPYKEKKTELVLQDENADILLNSCFSKRSLYLAKARNAYDTFQKNVHDVYGDILLSVSLKIAQFDVLSNFANISKENHYVKPTFLDSQKSIVNFVGLRHPVVEATSQKFVYVPHTVSLGQEDSNSMVIYGANSSGKSTFLKSTAIAILMSHIGCFIPAKEGKLSTFDSIQTRISSNDNLAEGMSTFVLEMTELNAALQYMKNKSLFLFDEIGRGTSVEDGESIAYGTLGYLNDPQNNSITLFATHYHSLYDKIKTIPKVKICHIHCYLNDKNEIVFNRNLMDGPGDGSYGIVVAKSCNLPDALIRLAENYSIQYYPLKKSRYNVNKIGIMCEKCKIRPVQETHHVVEQKQGKVKNFIDKNGVTVDINHASNLEMLCSYCHEEITRLADKKRK